MPTLRNWAILALLLLSLGDCKKEDEPETGSVLVQITNPEGPVGEATIRTQPPTPAGMTNGLGTAFLSNLLPGDYLITASHPALGAADTLISVVANRTTEIELFLTATFGQPATIQIEVPDADFPFFALLGQEIYFRARIADPNGPETTEVVWESSRDGFLRRQRPTPFGEAAFATLKLSEGEHRIYATVNDPLGWTAVDSTAVTILPRPAAVRMLAAEPSAQGPRLSWSTYDQTGFFAYYLYRKFPGQTTEAHPIYATDRREDTTFLDKELPYGTNASYWVEVRTDYGITPRSNVLEYATQEVSVPLAGPVVDLVRHPVRKELYLLSRERSQLDIFDMQSQTLVASLPVHALPNDMALDAAQGLLYVAGGGSSFIDVIDVVTREVVRTINTSLSRNTIGSHQVTIGTIGSAYLVLAGIENIPGLSLLDPQTGEVLDYRNDGFHHIALAVHPQQPRVYISSGYGQNALRSYDVIDEKFQLAAHSNSFINGGGIHLFLSENGENLFYNDRQYDPNQLATVLGTFSRPLLAGSPDGSLVFGAEGVFSTQTYNFVFTFRQPIFGLMYFDNLTQQLYATHQWPGSSSVRLVVLRL